SGERWEGRRAFETFIIIPAWLVRKSSALVPGAPVEVCARGGRRTRFLPGFTLSIEPRQATIEGEASLFGVRGSSRIFLLEAAMNLSEFEDAYEDQQRIRGALLNTRLSDLSLRKPVVIEADASVVQAVDAMNEHRTGCVLVAR